MVRWLAVLFFILEVSGSNFGLENGYADWGLLLFSSISSGKYWDSNLN